MLFIGKKPKGRSIMISRHRHRHTHRNTYTLTHVHACARAHSHSHSRTRACTHMHAHMHTNMRARAHVHVHVHAHAHALHIIPFTNIHIHMYTHKQSEWELFNQQPLKGYPTVSHLLVAASYVRLACVCSDSSSLYLVNIPLTIKAPNSYDCYTDMCVCVRVCMTMKA